MQLITLFSKFNFFASYRVFKWIKWSTLWFLSIFFGLKIPNFQILLKISMKCQIESVFRMCGFAFKLIKNMFLSFKVYCNYFLNKIYLIIHEKWLFLKIKYHWPETSSQNGFDWFWLASKKNCWSLVYGKGFQYHKFITYQFPTGAWWIFE